MKNQKPIPQKIECPECDQEVDWGNLYEFFLQQLHEEIEKMPLTYDSTCSRCKETVVLPSYVWGRYCKGCNYKLSSHVSYYSLGGCVEDICTAILSKFGKTDA